MEAYLKNKKVGEKLKFSFATIMVAFIVTVVVAIAGIVIINSRMKNFYTEAYRNSMLQMEVRKDVQLVGKTVLWAVTEDENGTKVKVDEAAGYAKNVADNIALLGENFDNQQMIADLNATLEELKAIRGQVMQLASEMKNDEALELFNGKYTDVTNRIQDILVEIGDYSDKQAAQAYSISRTLGTIIEILMVVLAVVSIILCVTLAKVITVSICTPVTELEAAAGKLKEGELEIQIAYESEDELGSLADNFRAACNEMQEVIEDVRYVLDEMAGGNFNVHTRNEAAYVGNFRYMLDSIRVLNSNLDSTLKQINEGSDQVAIGSGQMADSAQSLAEGATDQAGAVQQLTATVENVVGISEQNAEGAKKAAGRIKSAVQDAEQSRTEMQNLNEAMARISDTSKEIENIIGAIEDIASQTNLLSLNASIEAARAGEAGKGFAVVADQIGKLAADSAQSAVTTRELIGKSLAEIETGNEITAKTTEAIGSVLISIEEFANMATESANASQTQADMLDQVRAGIEQISTVVQNNSAAAEETSAVSEELSAQSESLKEMVAKFNLKA